jgi:ABC-type transport system involved in multi-copper enzyme maturation permease subunit
MNFVGPVFWNEIATAPRRVRFFVGRVAYGLLLVLVVGTTWLVVQGIHALRGPGDTARFGETLLAILAALQLTLVLCVAAVASASSVNQEKDRRTLSLLLLTRLTNHELVLGKLSASLAGLLAILAAGLPVFGSLPLLGGVSWGQVGRVTVVTLATALAAGSLGVLVAFWRDKTFQTLALLMLIIVGWLGLGEAMAAGWLGTAWGGVPWNVWAATFSPWRALLVAMVEVPQAETSLSVVGGPVIGFVLFAAILAILLNGIAIARVRVWNTTQEPRPRKAEPTDRETIFGPKHVGAAVISRGQSGIARARRVWDRPVLWREMRTWAYGKRIVIVRLFYLLAFGAAAWGVLQSTSGGVAAVAFVSLAAISLALINALGVTSITMERDLGALDLLLVTDLSAREVVFGKLAGAVFNAKEMVLLPLALCAALAWTGVVSLENASYIIGTLLALDIFAAVLGLHCGMLYERSRTAIAVSLGTLLFLLVGVGLCVAILVAFADPFGNAFTAQLPPFLAFMLGGTIGLWLALSSPRPSPALGLASILLPLATFWAITSYFLRYTQGVAVVVTAAYAFATLAMLLPALADLDTTIGRNREQ